MVAVDPGRGGASYSLTAVDSDGRTEAAFTCHCDGGDQPTKQCWPCSEKIR